MRETHATKSIPGAVWLSGQVWMDAGEVRNTDWLEFLYWLKRKDTAMYRQMLPDTTGWDKLIGPGGPYQVYYLRHPAYRNYPVTGITPPQAATYCKWRGDRLNEMIALQKKEIKVWKTDSVYAPKQRIRCRLPSLSEWEQAAGAHYVARGRPYTPHAAIVDRKGQPVNMTGTFYPHENLPWPVNAGQPNYYGIYGLGGNVSELVADHDAVKGQSFRTTNEGVYLFEPKRVFYPDTALSAVLPGYRYVKPECWIGFRCVYDVMDTSGK